MESSTFAFLAVSTAVALCMGSCKSAPEPEKAKSPDSQARKAFPPEPATLSLLALGVASSPLGISVEAAAAMKIEDGNAGL